MKTPAWACRAGRTTGSRWLFSGEPARAERAELLLSETLAVFETADVAERQRAGCKM